MDDDSIEYEIDRDEEPRCFLRVEFVAACEEEVFTSLIAVFVRELEFVALPPVQPASPSPMHHLPLYHRPEMFLRAFCVVHPDANYGQTTLSVRRRDFPQAEFEQCVRSFVARFHGAFPGRVSWSLPSLGRPRPNHALQRTAAGLEAGLDHGRLTWPAAVAELGGVRRLAASLHQNR